MSHPNQLQFEFQPGAHDEALGFGVLRVCIGNSPVWSDSEGRGIPWTWIDLLEQLARAWPFLKYEENAPVGAYDGTLSLLRTGHFASAAYDVEPGVESTRETYVFLRRHNLATGIEGLYLPSLSLLREGRKMWVASPNITKLLDLDQALQKLAQLGDVLAAHVASGREQERSRLAIEAWKNREPSLDEVLQIRLGLSQPIAKLLPKGQTIAAYFEVDPAAANEESSLLAAARMSDVVPIDTRVKILDLLRTFPPKGISPLLQDLSAEAESKLPNYVQRAHKEGEALAQWAREKFKIPPEGKADPQDVLQRLGVEVKLHGFGMEAIDAIGCWGHRHGPVIVVNVDGKHAQSSVGRRATLAHELAHLLVDRNGSLPAAEVLGGNVPRHPEQRANAFAAEFLLPKKVAIERIRSSSDVSKTIERLPDQFAVSRELAAWQIINSPVFHLLESDQRAMLRGWTPNTDSMWF